MPTWPVFAYSNTETISECEIRHLLHMDDILNTLSKPPNPDYLL